MLQRGTEKNREEEVTVVSAPCIELHTKLKEKKSPYPLFLSNEQIFFMSGSMQMPDWIYF